MPVPVQQSGFLKPRFDMNDHELALWVYSLGHSDSERIAMCEEMLENATRDQMDSQDQQLVRGVLNALYQVLEDKTRPFEKKAEESCRIKRVIAPHPAYEESDDYYRYD